jgi:ribosomal protein S18 acetylase RimI-like enzyme
MELKLTTRKCTTDDLPMLCALSRNTYDETFRHLNTPENMAAYLDAAFHPGKLKNELLNPESAFYFLYRSGAPAGYLKLNTGAAQTDLHAPEALEIERIFVTGEHQGQGLGSVLLDKAEAEAIAAGKTYLWLGVWEQNERALVFYKKNGFYVIGTHDFVMGDDVQTDFVMRKDL